ncbi:hypothetical protein PN36_21115 [Candidatus Thiomargarita nelsonii]|uniref:Uncharacterized protein n=1 Tax=Candidatus Thiomargarita nelsonii TaxID=1003181 RepID=A0A4E0QNZ3_9GAMM|nr:hypothetical protein PN36_21115 [Candidatus Thiomargarita nelsonii]
MSAHYPPLTCEQVKKKFSRSHALRGNAFKDAPRPASAKSSSQLSHVVILVAGRGASKQAFPRRAWEREKKFFNIFQLFREWSGADFPQRRSLR